MKGTGPNGLAAWGLAPADFGRDCSIVTDSSDQAGETGADRATARPRPRAPALPQEPPGYRCRAPQMGCHNLRSAPWLPPGRDRHIIASAARIWKSSGTGTGKAGSRRLIGKALRGSHVGMEKVNGLA